MSMRIAQGRAGLLAGLLLGVAGCDRPAASELAPVHGKVFYQNRPLTVGTIVFTPDPTRGTGGPISFAEIQADGSYVLQTSDGPGAVAGWHRVTISAIDVPVSAAGVFAPPRSLLPAKYRDPDQSGLHCEIRPGRDNGINFHLE